MYKEVKKNTSAISSFQSITKDILSNDTFKTLDSFVHHRHISILEHSIHVAFRSYLLAKKLSIDPSSTARGALLHDFYLYDWHQRNPESKTGIQLHGFKHPKVALNNAKHHFDINAVEADIIEKHMWPLTIHKLPRYKASLLVLWVDKYCSFREITHQETRSFVKQLVVEVYSFEDR
ncbi:HD domain-containing protein [Tindallia californiensis]|uniref:HD domain-containing protein n=1 Tax=Tindallia californiensis TaxID=159292 RepID=A0A1H3JZ97_9FIRM|nr:HD domain-containing protein [Tindallia californiensis]SDY44658.1 uncharacterized protein SAMN05192546_102149 [Tindallia californiensis]